MVCVFYAFIFILPNKGEVFLQSVALSFVCLLYFRDERKETVFLFFLFIIIVINKSIMGEKNLHRSCVFHDRCCKELMFYNGMNKASLFSLYLW